MRILHYSLGFPPYRTGGMTKYVIDLALYQVSDGHEVGLLWPGGVNLFKQQAILKRKSYKGIKNYEIINPLPVPLDEGIVDVDEFVKVGNKDVIKSFFQKEVPDVLHIHTLMGFHREILDIAHELGIRTVFTTHDYFGICPKVTLFHWGRPCNDDHNCVDCVRCNRTALSLNKIYFMQSRAYRLLKDTSIAKMLRRKHRRKFFDEPEISDGLDGESYTKNAEKYIELRKYYLGILENVDCIHFNSSVAEQVYRKFLFPKQYKTFPVTHSGICGHKKRKKYDSEKLRITYLGPAKPFKGYKILKQALDELWDDGIRKFELHIFSSDGSSVAPYVNFKDGYQYCELEQIFDDTDILVAPSSCYETFGFTVLEALSYGVPVIVSENVGAKDLLNRNYGLICSAEKDDLKNAITRMFDRSVLMKINKNICDNFAIPKLEDVQRLLY